VQHPVRPLLLLSLGLLAACGDDAAPPAPKQQAPSAPAATASAPAAEPAPTPAPEAPPPAAPPASEPAAQQADPANTNNSLAAAVPAPKVLESKATAALRDGPRSPAEIAEPFRIPEEERSCPTPYAPGVTVDTPLVAAGVEIPADEVKRQLCLGLGYAYSDFAKFQIVLEEELARRKAAGEDLSKYDIDEAALEHHLEKQKQEFALRYPTLDFELEVGRAYISHDLYREPARQSLLFDRLFLPENPADWPELTVELIRGWAGASADDFIQDAFSSYERRKQMMIEQNLDEIPAEDPVLVGVYKDEILKGLNGFSEIEMDPAKLPAGALMTVDGQVVPIQKVWGMIGPYVSAMDLAFARRFMALCKVLEQDFASKGMLLSQEEFEKAWTEPGMTYRQKLDQHQLVAGQVIGMQSMHAYALYQRLLESLRRELADKLEDEALLREWSPITNEVTGAAKRDIEMILCSAWDGDKAAWKDNGWETARNKVFGLKAELDKGADWTALRELHSEFWDPPMPDVGQKPMFALRFKGAFGMQTRNQLLNMVEESEGHELVFGRTISDTVFYEQEVGTIAGPFMGPKGYYLTRLTGRTPAARPLDLTIPLHRLLVQNFYLRVQLHKRAQELLQKGVEAGTVKGV
jgi:hypothetical protein